MKLIIHGDDYGRSKGITDTMSACIDNGYMNSVSIPANGYGFEYGIEQSKKRILSKSLRISVHIDLVEWKPVSPQEKVNLLTNNEGYYKYDFLSLWLKYLISNSETKVKLREQVKTEMEAQISKVKNLFPDSNFEINIDSHQHLHMVPFVFESLIQLNEKYKINYIRLGNEPFFFCFEGRDWWKSYLGPNIIKHFLLKILSVKYIKLLRGKNINFNNYFIGLLFTSRMNINSVKSALKKIKDKNCTVEVLFHACKATRDEEKYWKQGSFLYNYYFSNMRDYEKEAVMSKELYEIISNNS